MKKQKWLTISVALTLAVVMLWTAPSLAQGRGKGQGQGQGWGCGQGQSQGQGAGYNTCPNYPASQGGQGTWCNNPQAGTGRRGPRGGGRASQPNTQPTVPPATQ
jgi:hypothetical protein